MNTRFWSSAFISSVTNGSTASSQTRKTFTQCNLTTITWLKVFAVYHYILRSFFFFTLCKLITIFAKKNDAFQYYYSSYSLHRLERIIQHLANEYGTLFSEVLFLFHCQRTCRHSPRKRCVSTCKPYAPRMSHFSLYLALFASAD